MIKAEMERALTITTQDEINYMERYLVFLATAAPWGRSLGCSGPSGDHGCILRHWPQGLRRYRRPCAGLAEALINTSMGLFVAIPAVISYNISRKGAGHRHTDGFLLHGILELH